MTSPIKIQQFRVSFIWFETQLALLDLAVPDPTKVPFYFLGRNKSYEMTFNQIKQAPKGKEIIHIPLPGGQTTALMLPWKSPKWDSKSKSLHKFWYYYLGFNTEDVTARLAWERFVPLRGKGPFEITASWLRSPDEWTALEAFYYPHGMALVATVQCNGDFALNDLIDRALQIRYGGQFDITLPGESGGALDYMALKAMGMLREQVWGKNTIPGPRSIMGDPFSIFTVIHGEGVDSSAPVASNEDIRNALYAVTEWSKRDTNEPLPPLAERTLRIWKKSASSPGDVLYGIDHEPRDRGHGRAVWFPETFLNNGSEKTLAAYHRNLLLTTLQVQSLCGLVYGSYQQLRDDNPFTPIQSECLRRAVDCLEHLYTGWNSYRSWSARNQLEKNKDMLKALNDVREFLNMEKILVQ